MLRSLLITMMLGVMACQPSVAEGPSDVGEGDEAALRGLEDLLKDFSATSGSHFFARPADAIASVRATLASIGIADPEGVVFYVSVGKVPITVAGWDHSELLITGGVSLDDGREFVLDLRAVGDPNGAGIFTGRLSVPFGPRLCMPWYMVEDLVRASYLSGRYLRQFVCHNEVSRVLRAVGVDPHYYGKDIRGWDLAMTMFGPLLRSNAPNDPEDWDQVQLCKALPGLLAGR